ncbi:hypothetical protein A3Q56_01020 [Intoshia linei]|uniref:Uncharacterized protein n=1 Tax=Intoshia linei TaxID=1819745 RepID=A0A177BA31_9BILA|nr:hypothetical protein A3Q56_01020 [Intoshia linei]
MSVENVMIIRSCPKAYPIFEYDINDTLNAWMPVSIKRHTKSLTYYINVDDDLYICQGQIFFK